MHAFSWLWRFAWRRTLWLCEVTLLNTGLESFVEHNIEGCLGCDVQALVVGFDILLDRLTAVVVDLISQVPPNTSATGRAQGKSKHEREARTHLLPLLSLSFQRRRVSNSFNHADPLFHRVDDCSSIASIELAC